MFNGWCVGGWMSHMVEIAHHGFGPTAVAVSDVAYQQHGWQKAGNEHVENFHIRLED